MMDKLKFTHIPTNTLTKKLNKTIDKVNNKFKGNYISKKMKNCLDERNHYKEAILALESFEKKWGKIYPQIAKSWYSNWANLVIFMQYPPSIKRIIYTTNAIESLNSQLRKVTNNKRVFPTDDAVFKTLYLTIDYITAKWNMPIQNWNEAMAHFLIKFEGRI